MDKLELQSTCFDNIKTLCVNYRKDSSTRKTVDYLNKRLSSLENQWKDFDSRHAMLVLELEDKKINYFTDDVYNRTKEMYIATKTDITNRLVELQEQKQNVQFDLTGTSDDLTVEEVDDKLQLLLNRQECNFNAIHRTITKSNTASISEQWELNDHLSTLKAKWEPIDKLHWEIDFLLKGSNEQYYKMFADVEQQYDELKTKLNSKIWSTAHYQKSAPKIELPEFSGNYVQWISFKDLFLETIHKNPVINNAQKMQHLKTKLRGEAERLVQHLTISAENYNSCWEILTQRYDNRRLQFTAYMNTMLNLPIIQQPDAFNMKKMHDVITECLNGISNIGIDISSWDPIIVHIMTQKLDSRTMSDYMKELQDHRELQNLQDFLYFIETQFMAYETIKSAKKGNSTGPEKPSTYKFNKQTPVKNTNYQFTRTSNFHASFGKCPHCKGSHVLMNCDKFLDLEVPKRNDTVSKLQLCKNCLYSHGNQECKSTKTCRECNLRHHTLLHNSERKLTTLPKNNKGQHPSTSTQPQTSNHLSNSDTEVLLTTVQLNIRASDGTYVTLRALLDQGSQVNLITENAAQILRLPRKKINVSVTGLGTVSGDCRGQLHLTCKSIHSNYTFEAQALIMKKLTNNLPTTTFEKTVWPHLENLKLADPEYNVSRQIDLILGAEVYSNIILDGVLKGSDQAPVAQQTHIGWILCGKMKTLNCHVTVINLEELTKFWETEDIPTSQDTSTDDHCEQFYKETVERAEDGKYIVKMPLTPDYKSKLGSSKSIAISQYLQLEKRLNKNTKLQAMYKQFINEYADLGHMKPAPRVSSETYYLPHHGVLRENALTTKLRVVFNASQKTSSGYSLNNLMEKGANLQKDIQSLILKWRTYRYAFTADIEKMFRCLWLSEDQQHLQRIIWRNSPAEDLQDYQLCTVTYGTKAAPWLAMRTLQQLAKDDGDKYPEAARALTTSCYMDDVIAGHNNILEAQYLQQTLIQLLKGAGMNLRKWTVNDPILLENLSEEQISSKQTFDFKNDEPSKTLGLTWNPNSDTFHFNWPVTYHKRQTKRSLLSDISKFYDPLGWLSPVTVTAKLLFQKVWMSKLAWDDEVPCDIEAEWMKLKTDLSSIQNMSLNRWIRGTQNRVELLGFCDASEKAFACVIYSRVLNEHNLPVITLLTAKTRVAPMSQKLTLPRLELCAAQLLANLMEKTKEAFVEYDISVQAWSDSQVVLAWIQGDATRWEAYVVNRVTKIKRIIPANEWHYVKSEQNPADCASRGLLPTKLLNFNLWWQGPDFLTEQQTSEDSLGVYTTTMGSTNCAKTAISTHQNEHLITTLLNKCSSLTRIIRVIAWIQRFITNLRNKTKSDTAHLTTSEINAATRSIVLHVQRVEFKSEYKQIMQSKTVSRSSSIYKLNPYLDPTGIIRVGGRLKNSDLPPEMKNPIIIPYKGRFTQLLIAQAHTSTLHGGPRLTLTYIRQRYWIVSGNRAVKAELQKCIRCHRFNKAENHQVMGDLPHHRITPCRPFTHTGVDFTGHVDIKLNKGRGVRTTKGYIAIFICMATKAVHIELVSDLSTETFLAAFQRFCARRGTPKHMYSDCGTNFIGAAKVLRQEFENFKQLVLTSDVMNKFADLEVEWHFNAPAWPSAGGLWEAAVKSMKHHLRRVLGEQKLTYEEFTTLLAKIEGCLNSRPLCPLTEDPEEFYNCLTPGHFLTGSPTMSLPLSDYNNVNNIDLRRRWQLTEHMFHQYWKNWSNEYLTTLQSRSKWNKPTTNIKQGDIVLVKDNNLPPAKWALGRVLETHPGADGYVRVTTIKTQSGIIKRPVVKLSPLPLTTEIEPETEHGHQTAPKTTSENKGRKKGQKCIPTLLITMISLFTFMSGSYCAIDGTRRAPGAHITNLETERPVYYDEIGRMQTMQDEWILIMYYNLTNYWEGTRRIESYFNHLKDVCQQTKLYLCGTTIEQLEHEMEILNYYNYILINPHKHLSQRMKRGLVDGVGYLANSLFGILDQRFAEKYENDIQSLQNNEDYLLELIKNQTSIVKLENDVLKKSEENIQRQFKLIDSFVNQTNLNLASIESEIQVLSATSYINSAAFTTYLLINNLRTFQEMLFNTLTNIYQGHLDVHLITPVHLIEHLNDISGSLPKTVSLPVENYKDKIKEFYKLINVKARVTDTYFIFEAHIPLVSNADFTIYKAIALPMKTANTTTYVRISSDYIAVNLKTNTFISLTEDDLKQCLQQNANSYLCKRNVPSYNLHSNHAPCEAKLLSQHNIAPCDIERAKCKDEWIQLHTSNSWLATCCDVCALRTLCDSDVTSYTITTTSIVAITEDCVLQSKDLTIYAHRQYSSYMKMDYELPIPTLHTSINKVVNLTYRYVGPLQDTSTSTDVKRIADKIDTLKEQENQKPTTISSHDVHQYAISYLLVAFALITLFVVFGRKRCRRSKAQPQNLPNGQHHDDIELQIIRKTQVNCQKENAATESTSHHLSSEPQPGSSRETCRTGTRNMAFNFD